MEQEKLRFDDLLKPKKRVDYLDQLEKRRQQIRKGDKEVAELVEIYNLEINNWAQICLEIGPGKHLIYPNFELCGNLWQLLIYPIGIDPKISDDGIVAVRLVNMSNESVRAAYCITIKSRIRGKDDLVFSDPEGIVLFEPNGKNDQWGTDDLISTVELMDPILGLYLEDKIIINLELELFQDIAIDLSPLSKAINGAEDSKDLIKLAKNDLKHILKKLPVQKSSEESVMKQQDVLLKHMLSTNDNDSKTLNRRSRL